MGGGDKLAERACRKRARERREGIAGHDKRRKALGGGPGMGGPIDPPTRRSARRPTRAGKNVRLGAVVSRRVGLPDWEARSASRGSGYGSCASCGKKNEDDRRIGC